MKARVTSMEMAKPKKLKLCSYHTAMNKLAKNVKINFFQIPEFKNLQLGKCLMKEEQTNKKLLNFVKRHLQHLTYPITICNSPVSAFLVWVAGTRRNNAGLILNKSWLCVFTYLQFPEGLELVLPALELPSARGNFPGDIFGYDLKAIYQPLLSG